MDISIFDIVENGISNTEISNLIINKLKEKYNEEFLVKMIGNRYGTSDDDTVTAFCFPKDNEKLLFTATLNKEETVLQDDYYLKMITSELQDKIKERFEKYNYNSVVKAEIVGVNELNENLEIHKFIDTYKNSNFLANIICSNELSLENLKEIYSDIESTYKNIHLKTLIYVIDEEMFKEFYALSQKIPSVTESIIKKYNIKDEKIIKIFEGNVNIIK